jgi:hypothetical protein
VRFADESQQPRNGRRAAAERQRAEAPRRSP